MPLDNIKQGFVSGKPLISFKEIGNGPPVIFLHGIGGNSDNWISQLYAISNNFTSIAWDARGYGESDDYDGPLKFEDFSNDLVRLMDFKNIEKAHLVGLSMGARILMNFFEYFNHPACTS